MTLRLGKSPVYIPCVDSEAADASGTLYDGYTPEFGGHHGEGEKASGVLCEWLR